MINNKFFFVFLTFFTFALAVPAAAQVQPWPDEAYNVLDLSEEQLAIIQEHRLAFQKEILSLRTTLMTEYMELDNLYLQNEEQSNIETKIAELEQMELELDDRFDAHQQQIRGLLTDEQKVLFDRFGGLGMGPEYGMGYGMGYGAGPGRGYSVGYGRGYGAGYGRGAWGRGAARNPDMRYRDGYALRGYGRAPARGYSRDTGYTRAPARGLSRGTARAGTAYRVRTPRDTRDVGRYVRGWFPRCRRWR